MERDGPIWRLCKVLVGPCTVNARITLDWYSSKLETAGKPPHSNDGQRVTIPCTATNRSVCERMSA